LNGEKQFCIYLSGIVQGVGMRYYIRDRAKEMNIKGYVRNLPDGRVQCVAQAEPEQLNEFISTLKNARRGRVDNLEKEELPLQENYSDFKIVF